MRVILITSVFLNLLVGAFFIYKKLAPEKTLHWAITKEQNDYFNARNDLFGRMSIDSNDVVFVGNSLTEGFPVQELFNSEHVKNRGISGNRIDQIAERIDAVLTGKPKKIFLMAGVNDLKNNDSVEIVFKKIASLLDKIKTTAPHTKLYLQSLLPTDQQYKRLLPAVKKLNALLPGYCNKNNIVFVDLFSAIEKEFPAMTYDGMHLNGKGYLKWKTFIEPYVLN